MRFICLRMAYIPKSFEFIVQHETIFDITLTILRFKASDFPSRIGFGRLKGNLLVFYFIKKR